MTFFDGISIFWIINIALALMLGLILLNFLSFVILFPVGIVLAVTIANIQGLDARLVMPNYLLFPSFYLLLFVFGITIIFFRNKEKEYSGKIQAMRALAGSIVHQISTPVSTISMLVTNIKFLDMTERDLFILNDKKQRIEKEIIYIHDTVNIILTRLSSDATPLICTSVSAKNFISEVIDRYPFTEKERSLVQINIEEDFILNINKRFMTHIVFNLLQNALYQIKEAQKGEIFIAVYQNRKRKIISIKDTATGIPKSKIESIFSPFITSKSEGTGIGLYFCKKFITAMNGNLNCISEYGKYAEFIIEF
ncbi:MAG: HAMP domain-containing histidine kinase [Holosporaceae bacterium]|jgi:signal transduction histidine kinase|nr:HAMP domain-containing histidine kinase [Holosporaceae bacterium]